MGIRHFLHDHPLLLSEVVDTDCRMCYKSINGECYGCASCLFYIHIPCSELGQKIDHHIHPHHVLSLVDNGNFYRCDACWKDGQGFRYRCSDCDFDLHLDCESLSLYSNIKYEGHPQHPVTLIENMLYKSKCEKCNSEIGNVFFLRCLECWLDFHVECGVDQLPPTILNMDQHPHPLTVVKNDFILNIDFYCCDVCNREINPKHPVCTCVECSFNAHMRCVITELQLDHRITLFHFSHPHVLFFLEIDEYDYDDIFCGVCEVDLRGFAYVCRECGFYVHPSCAGLPREIQHHFHRHPLTQTSHTQEHECDACHRSWSGTAFRCHDCYFDLCVDCSVQRPSFKFIGHEHKLTFFDKLYNRPICRACNCISPDAFYLRCVRCDFNVHLICCSLPETITHWSHDHSLTLQNSVYCCQDCQFVADFDCVISAVLLSLEGVTVSFKPIKEGTGETERIEYSVDDEDFGNLLGTGETERIEYSVDDEDFGNLIEVKHFSHSHPLTLLKVDDTSCMLCYEIINGQCFGCFPCLFYIHKSCSELPIIIEHSFHSSHPLILMEANVCHCKACGLEVKGFNYSCRECNFNLHTECAFQLRPNIRYESHKHLLILIDSMANKGKCGACHDDIRGNFCARCVECDINYHVHCEKFIHSQSFVHKHHEHPLTLAESDSILPQLLDCTACCKEIIDSKQSFLRCAIPTCEYHAHMRCVTIELQLEQRVMLKHFSHQHFLFPYENENSNDVSCCEEAIQGPLYGCGPCKYYLHQSCAELPRRIPLNPFHKHQLTLQQANSAVCKGCRKQCKGFIFYCEKCSFYLDVECTSLQPSIVFKDHNEHFLTFFEKLHDNLECLGCNFISANASYLRCVRCNFNVHTWCCPLPQTIKDESHFHPLTLTDSVDDKNYDEQFCDVCEEKRDPQECVYYCEECDFVAEFNCVISKVMPYLKNEKKDVELITIKRDKPIKKCLYLQAILDSFTDKEEAEVDRISGAIRKDMENVWKTLTESDDESSYLDKILLQLMMKLKSSSLEAIYSVCWDPYDEVVSVGDYKITKNLAPILEKLQMLIVKYGDIFCNHTPSENLTTIFLVRLCGVMQSMCDTKVNDITNELMLKWWKQLKFVQHGGLRIDFSFDHWKRISEARDVFVSKVHQNSKFYKVDLEMAGLTQQVEKQLDRLKKLRRQKMEALSELGESSRRDEERMSEAVELIERTAGAGLLDVSKLLSTRW